MKPESGRLYWDGAYYANIQKTKLVVCVLLLALNYVWGSFDVFLK